MKITAVIGRAGCGKSRLLFEEAWANIRVREPRRIIFLVPEQATHHAERRLIEPGDISGCFRTEVISFRRLFQRLDKVEGHRIIDEVEKRLLIAGILRGDDFNSEPFASIRGRPGFIAKLGEQIKLLKRSETDSASIGEESRKKFEIEFTGAKLAFVQRMFDEYRRTLASRELRDAEDCIDQITSDVKDESDLRDASWFIDGFSGFTPQEKSALEGIMSTAAEVKIALCLDPELAWKDIEGSRELFGANKSTFEWFKDFATKQGIEFKVKTVKPAGKKQRFLSPGIAGLEENLFARGMKKADTSGVSFIPVQGERETAHRIAYEIKKLASNGYRYRDIAVVLRAFGRLRERFTEAFNIAGIPYFIDRREPLRRHPVSRLVNGLWELSLKNFHRDVFLDLVRTGLLPIGREDADALENYLLEYGLSFDLIYREWLEDGGRGEAHGKRGERWMKLRDVAVPLLKPLVEFIERVEEIERDKSSIDQYGGAVLALLDAYGIEKRMLDIARDSRLDVEDESRIYKAVLEIPSKISEVMGDSALSRADYAAVLRSALDSLSTGRIPPVLDAVIVGEIHRSRIEEARAVFICGLEEGSFPRPPSGAGLFDEKELRGLSDKFPEWAVDYRRVHAEEEYLFYIACTRAREKLYLIYPVVDETGGAPSPFVREAKRALNLPEDTSTDTDRDVCLSPGEASGRIAAAVSEGNFDAWVVGAYAALNARKLDDKAIAFIFKSLAYDNQPKLEERWVAHRAGGLKQLDATRLKAFADCPFRYFARYDMDLQTRMLGDITSRELGTFIHEVLEKCFSKWFSGDSHADVGDINARAEEAVDIARKITGEFNDGALLNNPRQKLLIETHVYPLIYEFVSEELNRVAHVPFKPSVFEWRFGDKKREGLKFEIPGKGNIELKGILDRIDVDDSSSPPMAIAYDYKYSSSKSGLASKVVAGLELQIPIYSKVLSELLGYKALACLFFHLVKDRGKSEEDAVKVEFKRRGMFMKGMVEGDDKLLFGTQSRFGMAEDEFNAALDEAFKRMGEYGRRLFDGDIRAWPYLFKLKEKPCSYCEYIDLCRFNPPINSYRHPESEF